VLIFSTST
jgi:hypothetical protein